MFNVHSILHPIFVGNQVLLRLLLGAVGIHLIIALHGYFSQIANRHHQGDIFIGLRMAHTTGKHEVMPIYLIKHQTFEDTRLTIVVIELGIKVALLKDLLEEHAAIGADHTEGDTVVNELLTRLILHHMQTVVSHTVDDDLIALFEPLHLLLLVIGLHTDGGLGLHHLSSRYDDIFTLFLLATADHQSNHQEDNKQLDFLHCLDYFCAKVRLF